MRGKLVTSNNWALNNRMKNDWASNDWVSANVERLKVKLLNIKWLNVKQLNIERLKVEQLNVEWLNIEWLNVNMLNKKAEDQNYPKLNATQLRIWLNIEEWNFRTTHHHMPFNIKKTERWIWTLEWTNVKNVKQSATKSYEHLCEKIICTYIVI